MWCAVSVSCQQMGYEGFLGQQWISSWSGIQTWLRMMSHTQKKNCILVDLKASKLAVSGKDETSGPNELCMICQYWWIFPDSVSLVIYPLFLEIELLCEQRTRAQHICWRWTTVITAWRLMSIIHVWSAIVSLTFLFFFLMMAKTAGVISLGRRPWTQAACQKEVFVHLSMYLLTHKKIHYITKAKGVYFFWLLFTKFFLMLISRTCRLLKN